MRSTINNMCLFNQIMLGVLIFNIVDFITTAILVDQHGVGIESNPLLYELMLWFDSVYAILWFKLILISIIWISMNYFLDRTRRQLHNISAFIVLLAFIGISTWNLTLILA